MEKIDFKKLFKDLYSPPSKNPVVVTVPKMSFLMIDGRGAPNTSADYRAAIEALYTLSYTLKFMLKKAVKKEYVVMPLEALWWTKADGTFEDVTEKAGVAGSGWSTSAAWVDLDNDGLLDLFDFANAPAKGVAASVVADAEREEGCHPA